MFIALAPVIALLLLEVPVLEEVEEEEEALSILAVVLEGLMRAVLVLILVFVWILRLLVVVTLDDEFIALLEAVEVLSAVWLLPLLFTDIVEDAVIVAFAGEDTLR